jgi:DNA-binding response OmpR family regulator
MRRKHSAPGGGEMRTRGRFDNVVLVVEDDQNIRQLLGQILELKGYSCLLLESVDQLNRVCVHSAPSAIVCDAGLPDGDGIQACLALRSRWPDLFVVLISGDIRSTEEALRAGFDRVLLKPFDIHELLSALKHESVEETH